MTNTVHPVCLKCEAQMEKRPNLALILEYRKDEEPDGPVPGFEAWSEAFVYVCPVCKREVAVPDQSKESHAEEIRIIESHEHR